MSDAKLIVSDVDGTLITFETPDAPVSIENDINDINNAINIFEKHNYITELKVAQFLRQKLEKHRN
jgi:predicted HAD superfamily phosphohydrolase YqeG